MMAPVGSTRRTRVVQGVVTLVLALAVPVVGAEPPPGTLDPSFGGDGKVVTALPNSDDAQAVAIQPDGRIVTAGFRETGTGRRFSLHRYLTDGNLDPSFGEDGMVVTPPIGPGSRDDAYSVALAPDGRIVAAGDAYDGGSTPRIGVARYNTDGSLDTTFSDDGVTNVPIGARGLARGVAVDAAGRVVVVGTSSPFTTGGWVLVARYSTDGTLDQTFGEDGWTLTTIGNSSAAHAVAIQPDGNIVVVGRMRGGGLESMVTLRYTAQGGQDTSFGGSGHVFTDVPGLNTVGTAVALNPDGKISAAGFTYQTFQMVTVRHRADGSHDPTFGGDGIVTTPVGGFSQAFGVAVDPLGRTLVAGDASTSGNEDFALLRFTVDGSLDPAFGSGGVVTTPVGTTEDHARGLALQPDGKILVAGSSDGGATQGDVAVVRYFGDPPPDTEPPDTTIDAAPPALTQDTTPTFGFSSSEPGSTFGCSMDGADFADCVSPHTTTVEPGTHTFAVRAADAAPNIDPSPATASFRVCGGQQGSAVIRLDGILRGINPALADAVLDRTCPA